MAQWRSSHQRQAGQLLAALLFVCALSAGLAASVARPTMHTAFKNAGTQEGLKIWRVEIQHFSKFGGRDPKFCTRDLMQQIMTNELAAQYSWAGWKKKMVFKELQLANVICDIVRVNFHGSTNDNIACFIKAWLVKARERSERAKAKSGQSLIDIVYTVKELSRGLAKYRFHPDDLSENFQPVPYPEADYGKFYTGDSYIVLFTKKDKKTNNYNWDIHFWLGNQTSQDEAGAAAILAVNLDDGLGGGPVQHREVQEHESEQFLGYFKSGVRYVPGGVASGFRHVDVNAPVEKALYQVKGKRNVRVRQVEPKVTSMNKGDCFILDTGRDIYVYIGAKAKGSERVKAAGAAVLIRDQDHGGRGKIYTIDGSSTPDEVNDFFKNLGGGSASQVADEPKTDDDQQFEQNQDATVALYKISDASGKVSSVKVSEKPLKQSLLDTNDAFILDTVTSGIYVWVGKGSTTQEKVEALKNAQAFITEKKYPSWTKITRVVEGAEPAGFREYFGTWTNTIGRRGSSGGSPTRSRGTRSASYDCEPAIGFMPDDGSGEMEIYRVENFELVSVNPDTYGKFFGGDSYVIKYKYNDGGREKYIIYFWQGKDSSQDEKASSAIHALRMDNELGGKAIQIRVTQGHEPAHFLRLFKGNMVVFLGGKASGFRNLRDHDTYDVDGTRLFEVRGSCKEDLHAVQVPEVASSLSSEGAYVLETPSTTYLWIGKSCSSELEELSEGVSELVAPGHSVTSMSEGDEPSAFWQALGGHSEYRTSTDSYRPIRAVKLFHCHVPFANKLRVEEISHFTQQDLFEDDVMVLDSGEMVYVWVGDQSTEEERKLAYRMAEEYLQKDSSDRRPEDAVIAVIKQGEEPQSFKSQFPEWDPDMWTSSESFEDLKRRIADGNGDYEDNDNDKNQDVEDESN